MKRVRIAVVGAGRLGTYHLQKLSADPKAELVGAVDIDAGKREQAAATFKIRTVRELGELTGLLDAVIIATPTMHHIRVAEEALAMGCHLLVEKPLAPRSAEARALIALAAARHRVLQVGHSERFNPAVAAALKVADRPRYIVTERLGPFSGRSTDVDVILDLMIHDLDIVASLIPCGLSEVRAVGVPIITTAIDMASARLQFEDGAVAQLSAGRASLEPSRKIRLFTVERYVSIDCAKREVKSVRRLPPDPSSPWPQIAGEPVEVPAGDPLALQDHDFLECILEGRKPRVDGAAGLRALELAEAVEKALVVPLPGTGPRA
ncbi:MAG: Gfo/Idh/MocA family oxidoreductase [Deltaproteobacteria bacterium]|nr:Gfo/Idh/MocA family oxidoreductase [Deltaproteobacteria bacterium]